MHAVHRWIDVVWYLYVWFSCRQCSVPPVLDIAISLSVCFFIVSLSVTNRGYIKFSYSFAPWAFSTITGRSSGRTFPERY